MPAALRIIRGFVPYGPSRAGAESLSLIMAEDLRPHGVTVDMLLPAWKPCGQGPGTVVPRDRHPCAGTHPGPAIGVPGTPWVMDPPQPGTHRSGWGRAVVGPR